MNSTELFNVKMLKDRRGRKKRAKHLNNATLVLRKTYKGFCLWELTQLRYVWVYTEIKIRWNSK